MSPSELPPRRPPARRALVHFALLTALTGAACDEPMRGPAVLAEGRTSAEVQQLEAGRALYGDYCIGCHGPHGDGNGQAATFLDPKPRDFRVGRLKFAAVAAGDPPRDEDYLRVITNGLAGTSMPSFALLSETERAALVAYVRTFNPKWRTETPGGALHAGRDPWRNDPDGGIAEGRRVYHGVAMCWSCHPAYVPRAEIRGATEAAGLPTPGLRPNLYQSDTKDSQWGAPIRAPDFLGDRIKTGLDVESIARVIASGVGGTAMPTWAGALSARQIYGVAHYVRSLALLRGTREAQALRAALADQPPEPPQPDPVVATEIGRDQEEP